MKNEFLKKLGISVCISSMVLGSSVMASTNINSNNVNLIMTRETSYPLDNFEITGRTNFSYSVTLSSTINNGKAFYSNNGTEDVTLSVTLDGNDVSNSPITISAGTGDYITWTKSGFGDKQYSVSVKSSATNLNGILSIGKSDKPL